METTMQKGTIKLTEDQKNFVIKILNFIAENPDLHDFAYGLATGKTVAFEIIERQLHAIWKTRDVKSKFVNPFIKPIVNDKK